MQPFIARHSVMVVSMLAAQLTSVATAADSELPAPRAVSYAEVLADPDDPEVNLAWARTQIERNQLTGASATLERVLLRRPELDRVRLLYAIVLYRLDNTAEARRELERLQRSQLPASALRVADDYLARIARRQRTTRYSATLTAGTEYESNRNAAPQSDDVIIFDTRFHLTGDNRRQDDGSAFALAQFGFEHDFAYQETSRVSARVGLYQSEQQDMEDFEVRALNANLGLSTQLGSAEVRPALLTSVVDLANHLYLQSSGMSVEISRSIRRNAKIHARLQAVHENYRSIREIRDGNDRSGLRTELGFGYELHSSRSRLGVDLNFTRKTAKRGHYGYFETRLALQRIWLWSNGTFLQGSLSLSADQYQKNQTLVSRSARRDQTRKARIVYGIPLNTQIGVDKLLLALNLELVDQESNIRNYAYENLKVGFSFTHRMEF